MPLGKQILRGSAGPLADAHLHILHDLEEFDSTNTGREPSLADPLACLNLS